MHYMRPIGTEGVITRQHDRFPAGERAPERVPALAAHDHRLAPGQLTEPPEVRLQPPRQSVIAPDDPILGHGPHDREPTPRLVHSALPRCGPVSSTGAGVATP